METGQFDRVTRLVAGVLSRRGLAGAVGLVALGLPNQADARKRKRKRKNKLKKKRKKTCGKVGSQPVKGKCCAGSVLVDDVCQRCDVCPSGCDYAAIQAAIDAAAPATTIAICPGTYRFQNLLINGDVRLVGAGDGEGSGNTIVQGTGEGSVVTVSGSVVALEHVRITGGIANYGGGISHAAGTLTLTDCTVSGNRANLNGGGIDNGGTLILTDSQVSGNTAGSSGGGITNLTSEGNVALVGSVVSGNSAGSDGGGIWIGTFATVTLDAASRVTGNTAELAAGGIYIGGTLTLASIANVSGNDPNNCSGTVVPPQCIG